MHSKPTTYPSVRQNIEPNTGVVDGINKLINDEISDTIKQISTAVILFLIGIIPEALIHIPTAVNNKKKNTFDEVPAIEHVRLFEAAESFLTFFI